MSGTNDTWDERRVARLLDTLRRHGLRVVTAESCTGGLIAGALTDVAGSSDVIDGGFVTYSNALKQRVLGVRGQTLREHGAVSEATVAEMASGALDAAPDAAIAVAVSGVAGPGGGSPEKPVGFVCFALLRRGRPPLTQSRVFPGDRNAVRKATVRHALDLIEADAART